MIYSNFSFSICFVFVKYEFWYGLGLTGYSVLYVNLSYKEKLCAYSRGPGLRKCHVAGAVCSGTLVQYAQSVKLYNVGFQWSVQQNGSQEQSIGSTFALRFREAISNWCSVGSPLLQACFVVFICGLFNDSFVSLYCRTSNVMVIGE